MQKYEMVADSKRNQLKNKLKGSLSSFKLNITGGQAKNITIADRSPVPGVLNNQFDQSFQLGRKIGEGSSGSVYTCRSKKDGKQYAVKISRGDVELLRISKRAFKIMKRLNHPNIIMAKCLYLNQNNQKIHSVMEYCPYPSLEYLEYRLSYQKKKQIVKQLLKTLRYLHSEGVCHRDIKLDNVLYSPKLSKMKLIDFGISKRTFDKRKQFVEMWTSTGTLRYMAPEMLSGSPYNLKVDMWALGVLIYKLFYGVFPFDCQYQSNLINLIAQSQPLYNQENILLNDLIKHLLRKDPKTRLSANQCLRHPWIENEICHNKIRQGSEDDISADLVTRLRNYSVGYAESPEIKCSREEKIQDLKELSIFQQKKIYSLSSSN